MIRGAATVQLTARQRENARTMADDALRAARRQVREARGWRLMSADDAARRYVDRRREARSWLALAGQSRRMVTYYRELADTGRAPAGSGWDPRVWGLPYPSGGVS